MVAKPARRLYTDFWKAYSVGRVLQTCASTRATRGSLIRRPSAHAFAYILMTLPLPLLILFCKSCLRQVAPLRFLLGAATFRVRPKLLPFRWTG